MSWRVEGRKGRATLSLVIACLVAGCSESTRAARADAVWWRPDAAPDELPAMLNGEPPFRYPLREYSRGIEGEVMLHLFVDTAGRVVPDSTRITEGSGTAALDAAALAGAALLRFSPARRRGAPVAVSLQFPVHFRHPSKTRSAPAVDSL